VGDPRCEDFIKKEQQKILTRTKNKGPNQAKLKKAD
jgi:hypothetical protein